MHKKHNKFDNNDLLNKNPTSRKKRIKCNIGNGESFVINMVPQNSKRETTIADKESAEEKLKHKRKHRKSHHIDFHRKPTEDIKLTENTKLESNHKTKEQKYFNKEKEKMYNIRRYLESVEKFNKRRHMKNQLSYSLDRYESKRESNGHKVRREKTIHVERPGREASSKMEDLKDKGLRHEEHRKHKHRSRPEKKLKDQHSQDNPKDVLYFHVETDNPFKVSELEKTAPIECYHQSRKIRKHSHAREKYDDLKEKIRESVKDHRDHSHKYRRVSNSPQRSKMKIHHDYSKERNVPEFIPPREEISGIENILSEKRKLKRRRHKNTEGHPQQIQNAEGRHSAKRKKKKKKSTVDKAKPSITKENSTSSIPDRFRVKIEEELKSYFTKIQTLVDKKIDALLHRSKSKLHVSVVENPIANDIPRERTRGRRKSSEINEFMPKPERQNSPIKKHQNDANDLKQKRHHREKRYFHSSPKDDLAEFSLRVKSFSKEHLLNSKALASNEEKLKMYSEQKDRREAHKEIASSRRAVRNKGYHYKENDFCVEGIEPANIELHNKTKKRKLNRNLECKTVSVIEIPSQIENPCTPLKLNCAEEVLERRKKTRRFKVYYKYSQDDNKCDSSEGKSVLSENCRFLSEVSEGNSETCEIQKELQKYPTNYMNSKNLNNYVSVILNEPLPEEKYYNVRDEVLRKIHRNLMGNSFENRLINISEEKFNISNTTPFVPQGKEIDCTFFKALHSSSSDYNVRIIDRYDELNSNPSTTDDRWTRRETSVNNADTKYVLQNSGATQKNENIKPISKHWHKEYPNYVSKSDVNISYSSLCRAKANRYPPRKKESPKYSPAGMRNKFDEKKYQPKTIDFAKTNNHSAKIEQILQDHQHKITSPSDLNYLAGLEELYLRLNEPIKKLTKNKLECNFVEKGAATQRINTVDVGTEMNSNESQPRYESFRKLSNFPKTADVAVEVTKSVNYQKDVKRQAVKKYTRKTADVGIGTRPILPPEPLKQKSVVERKRPSSPNRTYFNREPTNPTIIEKPRYKIPLPKTKTPVTKDRSTDINVPKQNKPFENKGFTMKQYNEKEMKGDTFIKKTPRRSTTPEKSSDYSSRRRSQSARREKLDKFVKLNISKSEISFQSSVKTKGSKVASLVCLHKYVNDRKFTIASKSNSHSLDHYIGKSIINDQPYTSRLFFTKEYRKSDVSAYQKRKIYDEVLRKKMKKKALIHEEKHFIPQIFEVRFVTVNGLENNTSKTSISKALVKKKSEETRKTLTNSKACEPTPESILKKSPKRNLKTKPAVVSNSQNKNTTSEHKEEILEKNLNTNEQIKCKNVCPSLVAQNNISCVKLEERKENSAENTSCGNIKCIYCQTGHNFMRIVDCLCRSVMPQYSSSTTTESNKTHPEDRNKNLTSGDVEKSDTCSEEHYQNKHLGHLSCPVFNRNTPPCSCKNGRTSSNEKTIQEFECVDFTYLARYLSKSLRSHYNLCNTSTQISENLLRKPTREQQENDEYHPPTIRPTIDECTGMSAEAFIEIKRELKSVTKHPGAHLTGQRSCPALCTTDFSYDFPSSYIPSLPEPRNPYLGFAFNSDTSLNKTLTAVTNCKFDQVSNDSPRSEESGYASNKSKHGLGVGDFFKKPCIAALLKPQQSDTEVHKRSGQQLSNLHMIIEYEEMAKKCQEYAQKVRIHAESNHTIISEVYEEIPLDILLGRRSSTNFNSNCCICKELSQSEAVNATESKNVCVIFEKTKRQSNAGSNGETSVGLIVPRTKQSINDLEKLISDETSISVTKQPPCGAPQSLLQDLLDCKVTVRCTNLYTHCITLVESSICKSTMSATSDFCEINEFRKYQTNMEKVEWECEILHLDTPSRIKKIIGKKFFENLLVVYEREIAVSSSLFRDKDFFENHLLICANVNEEGGAELFEKGKKSKIKSLFSKKARSRFKKLFHLNYSQHKTGSAVDTALVPEESQQFNDSQQYNDDHQRQLQAIAHSARGYFSMFVEAVKENREINDEMKICGLLKLLEQIENGHFRFLRQEEEVNHEEEIKNQVKQAFRNMYTAANEEAEKINRSLSVDDIKLLGIFVCKYRIGLLSGTDLIASYIGRGFFSSEIQLKAAVTYLMKTNEIDPGELEDFCKNVLLF